MTPTLTNTVPTTTGTRGLRLIEKWEGLYLHSYRDPVGIWTIGWGTISNAELGIKVGPGMTCTREQAEEWLQRELRQKEASIRRLVKVPLTQDQFDALSSFVYNLGEGTLQKSTLLKLLNQGNYEAVPAQIMRYTHAGGQVLQGLVNRRRDECKLWRSEHIDEVPDTPRIRVNPTQIKPTVPPVDQTLEHLTKSNTGRIAVGQMATSAVGMMQFAGNPLVFGVLVVIAGLSGYILYRKFHDLQEGR